MIIKFYINLLSIFNINVKVITPSLNEIKKFIIVGINKRFNEFVGNVVADVYFKEMTEREYYTSNI